MISTISDIIFSKNLTNLIISYDFIQNYNDDNFINRSYVNMNKMINRFTIKSKSKLNLTDASYHFSTSSKETEMMPIEIITKNTSIELKRNKPQILYFCDILKLIMIIAIDYFVIMKIVKIKSIFLDKY